MKSKQSKSRDNPGKYRTLREIEGEICRTSAECTETQNGTSSVCRLTVRAGLQTKAVRYTLHALYSVLYLPGFSRDFDCFDFSLEWDGMSGMEVVFDSLIFWSVLIV